MSWFTQSYNCPNAYEISQKYKGKIQWCENRMECNEVQTQSQYSGQSWKSYWILS